MPKRKRGGGGGGSHKIILYDIFVSALSIHYHDLYAIISIIHSIIITIISAVLGVAITVFTIHPNNTKIHWPCRSMVYVEYQVTIIFIFTDVMCAVYHHGGHFFA